VPFVSVVEGVVCLHIPLTFGGFDAQRERLAVGCGLQVFSPPSSLLRLNPSVLYTERRRPPSVPFSGHVSVRSNHAALIDDCDEEECNRLGSVFIGCCVRLST
jgi:hypothetical protein